MPWPDVQPPLMRALSPTRKPPMTSRDHDTCVVTGTPPPSVTHQSAAPTIRPAASTSRHVRVLTNCGWRKNGRGDTNDHAEVNTELIPLIAPVKMKMTLTPAPMRRPPAK